MSISVCTDDVRLGTELWNWYCTRIERVYNIIKSAKAAALHKLKGINMSGLDTPPSMVNREQLWGNRLPTGQLLCSQHGISETPAEKWILQCKAVKKTACAPGHDIIESCVCNANFC